LPLVADMPSLSVAHDIRRNLRARRRTLGGRPLWLRRTLTCRRPLLNRRAVLHRTALLSGLALLLRGLALLRRRTLLGCLALWCPITNCIPVDCIAPNLLTTAQTLPDGSPRRANGSGSGKSSERLTATALLQPFAPFR
jgi:hypothetical protein